MDVSTLATRLGTISEFGQVVTAETGGNQTLVDTSAEIVSLFGSTFGSRVWPSVIPEANTTLPCMTYEMVSSKPLTIDGHHILHQDQHVLTIRDPDYDNLIATVATVVALMSDAEWALEITDRAFEFEPDRNAFAYHFETMFTYLVGASQTLPAAFVYPIQRAANDSEHDSWVTQLVRNEYGIVLITDTGVSGADDIPTLQDAVSDSLLGWEQGAAFQEMRYQSGNSMEGTDDLQIWREVYFDATHLREV